ncbi:MAG: hypothetical protein ACK46X_01810 [Candidatus Sericytochromatia bacterium]
MRFFARSAVFLGLLALSTAPLIGALPAPAFAAEPATRVGEASFDPATSAIVVPYTGAAPKPVAYTISGSHHYYELPGARLSKPAVQFHRVGGHIERYTLADRPEGGVRVSFKLTTAAKPTVEVDTAGHRLLIWPLGKAGAMAAKPAAAPVKPQPKPVAAAPKPKPAAVAPKPKPTPKPVAVAPKPKPKPKPAPQAQRPAAPAVRVPTGLTPPTAKNVLKTEVGKPYFDDFNHRLVLPYKGEEPDFTVVVYYKNPKWVYFDFANAYVSAEGQKFETFTTDTAFDGWMLSQRQGALKTRLYLKLKAETQIVAQVHPESRQIWLEVPGKRIAKPAAPKAAEPEKPVAPEPTAAPEASPETDPEHQ